MKLSIAHEYAYPVETVWEAFRDPSFVEAKFMAIGAREVNLIKCDGDADSMVLVVEREVELDAPSVLKSFLGRWNRIVQSENWTRKDDQYVNKFRVNAGGVPVRITGVGTLRPDEDGCVYEIDIEVVSEVPLVGRTLAQFVGTSTEETLDAEFDYTSENLEGFA